MIGKKKLKFKSLSNKEKMAQFSGSIDTETNLGKKRLIPVCWAWIFPSHHCLFLKQIGFIILENPKVKYTIKRLLQWQMFKSTDEKR